MNHMRSALFVTTILTLGFKAYHFFREKCQNKDTNTIDVENQNVKSARGYQYKREFFLRELNGKSASEKARKNANLLNVVLPDGYTIVVPNKKD